MQYIFSNHAIERMQERNIRQEWVEMVLANPEKVITGDELFIYQSVFNFDGKRFLIRVFVNINEEPNKVITVYKTSKIAKYEG